MKTEIDPEKTPRAEAQMDGGHGAAFLEQLQKEINELT